MRNKKFMNNTTVNTNKKETKTKNNTKYKTKITHIQLSNLKIRMQHEFYICFVVTLLRNGHKLWKKTNVYIYVWIVVCVRVHVNIV